MNHSKINTFIVSVLIGIPVYVDAQQILPNPNPLDSMITVDASAENSLHFSNAGIISVTNLGSLNNFGTLVNGIWSSDTLGVLGYHGSLINAGSINNTIGGNLSNYGYLSSSGLIENSGILSTGTTDNHTGFFENSGLLNNFADGTLTTFAYLGNQLDGTLNNYGILNIGTPDDPAGYLGNAGDLANFGNLTIDGLLNNTSNLSNAGTLLNTGSVVGGGFYTQTLGQTIVNGWFDQTSSQFLAGNLSGAGIIAGEVLIDTSANVNPGNASTDTLTVNGDFNSNGNLFFEIAGLAAFDVLDINGDAFFGGGMIEFQFIDEFHATAGNYWDFFFSETISGRDSINFVVNGLDDDLSWSVIHIPNQGERLLISAIPEPEAYLMLLAGLGLIAYMNLQRRRIMFRNASS